MKQQGFGLIEAMVSVLIIAIASSIAFKIILATQLALLCEAGGIKQGCKAVILSDPATGCQYIVSQGSVTPRLMGSGQMGCRPGVQIPVPTP